jgi:hypothetical protein
MINYRLFFSIFIFLSLVFTVYSEENKEEIKSLKEERLETINYGIDTQVIELINTLDTEKNYDFNSDLLKLLKSTTNSRLDQSIIGLFKKSEDDSAVVYAYNQLEEDFNLRDDTRVVYINYISKYQTHEISEYLLSLIDEESNAISIASIPN